MSTFRQLLIANITNGNNQQGNVIPMELDKAGTIIGRDTNGEITFVGYEEFGNEDFDVTSFTPISVLVIPSTHTKDRKCRGVSLVNMDADSPEEGNINETTMMWGVGSNIEAIVDYKSATTGNVPIGGTLGLSTSPYLPTDAGNMQVPSVVDTINGIPQSSYYERYSPFVPSPYTAEGLPNPQYTKGVSNDKLQCNTDMNGKGNTRVVINIIKNGSAPYILVDASGPIFDEQNNYTAFACCHRYQGGGFTDHSWYLPSFGELGYFVVRRAQIANSLEMIRMKYGRIVSSISIGKEYWTSTESATGYAWSITPQYGKINYYGTKYHNKIVRAFHAF